jgi:5-methylcytosine-specific restriction endonuclease McrA
VIVPDWPHCETCSCRPEPPSRFISDVRLLPVDLDRVTTYTFKNGGSVTGPVLGYLTWRPGKHSYLAGRVGTYRMMIRSGDARNVREAVKMLAVKRREWLAQQTAQRAEWLGRQVRTQVPCGYERALLRKKEIVRAEMGDVCRYCGAPGSRVVEHMVPTSRGGDHRRKNLTISCSRCNGEKGKKTPAEWQQWRLARGLPWPPPPSSPIAEKVS